MKRIVSIICVLVSCFPAVWSQEALKIKIDTIPESIEDYLELRESLGQTPEGAAALFVVAMIRYGQDPVVGMHFFTVILVNDSAQIRPTSKGGYKGFEPSASAQYLIKRIDNNAHVGHSYVSGTSPANGYQIGSFPVEVETSRNNYSQQNDGAIRLFVRSSGADSPRPLTLKKNSQGIWKVAEFSSLVVGIRKAELNTVDEL